MFKRLWLNRNIRLYLIGGGISKLGDVLSGLAFLFIAYDLTGSNFQTTGMALAETLPYLLFGLAGGVIADWTDKKRLLVSLDLVRVPLTFSIVLLQANGILSYNYLLFAAFCIQTIGCFFNPAHRSVLPLVADNHELPAANSANDSLARGITVLSPLISIWLLHRFSAIHFFTFDSITYLISAFCLSRLNFDQEIYQGRKSLKALFTSIWDFFKWGYERRVIRQLFSVTFLVVFFNTWVWDVGLLLALTDVTDRSEELFSLLKGIFGATVIITNLILPFILKRYSIKIYLTGAFIWGLGISLYGFTYEVWGFVAGVMIVGVGLPVSGLTRVYLLQKNVPQDLLGRAFSSNAFLLYLANTLSLAIYGVLSVTIPSRWLMAASGLMILLISVLLLTTRKIRSQSV